MTLSLSQITDQAVTNSHRWFPRLYGPDGPPLNVYFALAIGGEVGELQNLAKKAIRAGACFDVTDAVRNELADIFIYLLLLANELGVDLEKAFIVKEAECETRWG